MTLREYINQEARGYFLPDMGTNGLYLVDRNVFEVYEDAQKQLELMRVMEETFPSDFVYTLCDGAILSDSLGMELLKPEKDFPSVISHPIIDRETLASYRVPDPLTTRRMSVNLESYRQISQAFDKPLYVSIQGPFTLAVQLAGATHLLRSIIKQPDYVAALLDFTKNVVKTYVKAVESAGARMISIAEPATVTLSRTRFAQLVVPSLQEIYDSYACWKSLHICGDTMEFLDLMLASGTDALSLDQIMDYREVAPKIPKDIVLIGNLDPLDLLHDSTPEEIRKGTLQLIRRMRPYDNYLCAFGCNCMNHSTPDQLQAAIHTARLPYQMIDAMKA